MLLNVDEDTGRVFWEVGKGPQQLGNLTQDFDPYPTVLPEEFQGFDHIY